MLVEFSTFGKQDGCGLIRAHWKMSSWRFCWLLLGERVTSAYLICAGNSLGLIAGLLYYLVKRLFWLLLSIFFYVFVYLASLYLMRIYGCNGSQDMWDWLWFSCEIVHSGKNLIFLFQEVSASIDKAFILAGGLGTGLSFYGV